MQFVVLNYESGEFMEAVNPDVALQYAFDYVNEGFNPDLIEVVFYDEHMGCTLAEFKEEWV